MALVITDEPGVQCPHPKIGCGVKYCFEEDEYVLSAGVESLIDIAFNALGTVVAGDELILHGYKFRFVAGAPNNLQEITVGAGSTVRDNMFAALTAIPFFVNNYTITSVSLFQIVLENLVEKVDPDYEFDPTIVDPLSIILNPFNPGIQSGTNATFKDDYYVYAEITNFDTGERVCPTQKFPLNILQNGADNTICIDIQAVVQQLPELFTTPPNFPTPALPVAQQNHFFDSNAQKRYEIRFYSEYDDDQDECGRVIGTSILAPDSLTFPYLRFVCFIQCIDDPDGFAPYCFIAGQPPLLMTSMPTDYKICADTPVELRFDFPTALLFSLAGVMEIQITATFSDGSTAMFVRSNLSITEDGINIISLDPNKGGIAATLAPILATGLSLVSWTISGEYIVFATTFPMFQTRVIPVSNRTTKGVCCDCHKTFYFVSKKGNNDVVLGKCESAIEIELDTLEICKEQVCGTNQFLGGIVPLALRQKSKIYTSVIEVQQEDYLDEFLTSTIKYEMEDDILYRIVPTESSYTIYNRREKSLILFKYKRSILEQSYFGC